MPTVKTVFMVQRQKAKCVVYVFMCHCDRKEIKIESDTNR